MDTETDAVPAAKKPPRKKTKKKSVKKVSVRKASPKRSKTKKKPAKRKVPAAKKSAAVPTVRLDIRLPKALKAKLNVKAEKTRRTITSIVAELIERMR